jgi:hypothetical protein
MSASPLITLWVAGNSSGDAEQAFHATRSDPRRAPEVRPPAVARPAERRVRSPPPSMCADGADESVNRLWYRQPEFGFEVSSASAAATLILRTKRIGPCRSRRRETPGQRAGRVFGTHRFDDRATSASPAGADVARRSSREECCTARRAVSVITRGSASRPGVSSESQAGSSGCSSRPSAWLGRPHLP